MKKFLIALCVILVSFGVYAEGWTFVFGAGSSSFQELDKEATVKSGHNLKDTNDKVGIAFNFMGDYKLNEVVSVTPVAKIEVPVKVATEETELNHYVSAGVGATYTKALDKGLVRTTVVPVGMFNVNTKKFGFGAKGILTTDVFINDAWSITYGGEVGFLMVDGKNWCNYGFTAGASVKF